MWKEAMEVVSKAPELNYMTQIVFMLFEDVRKPEGSLDKYHVDIHFSPGIKGRRELIFEGSNALLKKASPELPEKSSQVFVKRLSHGSMISASTSEAMAMKRSVDAAGGSQVPSGPSVHFSPESTDQPHFFVPRHSLGKISEATSMAAARRISDGAIVVGGKKSWGGSTYTDGGVAPSWDNLPRRYVTSLRPSARTTLLGDNHRKFSAPSEFESLRSFSDTRLVDRDKSNRIDEEKQSPAQRKKSFSDSQLEPNLRDFCLRTADSATRSKSDGDVTTTSEGSPKLKAKSKSSSNSSPELDHAPKQEKLVPPHFEVSPPQDCKTRVKKFSLPSMNSSVHKPTHAHTHTYTHSVNSSDTTSTTAHSEKKSKSPRSPKRRRKQSAPLQPGACLLKDHSHFVPTKKPSKKLHLSTDLSSKSLTTLSVLSEQKKWGSIEGLQENFPGEVAQEMDSQKSMVVRGELHAHTVIKGI